MLHDILYALIGQTGDVIIFQDDKFIVNPSLYKPNQFEVSEHSILTASEAELINKIASLGAQYKLIKDFLDRYSGLSSQLALNLAYDAEVKKKKEDDESEESDSENQQLHGVYIKAFCSGVNEMLTIYKEHILAIEREYLKDRSLTVLSLQQKFGIYFQMFPAILNLMYEIEEQSKRGGEILNTLYQKCTSGNPIIKNMFAKILFCCHKVFYHQLNAWIVHGQLVDICEEFFIHKIDHGSAASKQINAEQTQPDKAGLNTTKMSINSVQQNNAINMIGQILSQAQNNFGATDDFFGDFGNNIENEWNISYTLRISMLPHCYISQTLANKILFIGKAVRVLQSKRTRQEDRIPPEELQAFSEAIMKMAKISEFNVILFSKIIEEIRECVASRLWHLVVHISDLMVHLKSIKDYFLLSKGEFYQTFLSDARHIMTLPPRTSAQDDLNLGPLQTTVSKLRLEDDPIMKNFKLKLRSFSFQFRDFSTLTGLVYDGDIRFDQQTNVLRITSTKNSSKSGCLWHSLKQRIDLGFKTSFAFKFVNPLAQKNADRGVNQSLVSGSVAGTPRGGRPSNLGEDSGPIILKGKYNEAAVAFVIQNEREVIPWKKKMPISTSDLNQFIAIKFVTRIVSGPGNNLGPIANRIAALNQLKTQVQLAHFVQVVASAETNIGKIRNIIDDNQMNKAQNKTEVILAEKEITEEDSEMNFMDNYFNQVIIDYNKENEELKVSFMDINLHNMGGNQNIVVKDPVIKMQLKLTDFIAMDNGSAFLGFTHETDNLYNRLFLKNWSFTSSFQSNKQDPWSGLSLDYNIDWPLHLLLNQDTIERYNQLFRFLLPIKRVQLELHTAWQQKVKTMKNMSDNELFRQAMQLRQHMQFLIDNIYSYLQVDVLEALWLQLQAGLKDSSDFEEVCKMHDNYLQQIIEQSFLNYSEVLKAIQDVLYVSQKLCKFLSLMDQEQILENEDFPEKFNQIKNNFELLSNKIFVTLSSYKNRSHRNSPQLAQLLLRIDYNDYFSHLQQKFEYMASQSIGVKGQYGFAAGQGY